MVGAGYCVDVSSLLQTQHGYRCAIHDARSARVCTRSVSVFCRGTITPAIFQANLNSAQTVHDYCIVAFDIDYLLSIMTNIPTKFTSGPVWDNKDEYYLLSRPRDNTGTSCGIQEAGRDPLEMQSDADRLLISDQIGCHLEGRPSAEVRSYL